MTWMNDIDVRNFLQGQKLAAYDPDTLERVAIITYSVDGSCLAEFSDGTKSAGQYGFVEDRYWTQYDSFRNGEQHEFRLQPLRPQVVQAYFADGRRAFVQSPLLSLLDEA